MSWKVDFGSVQRTLQRSRAGKNQSIIKKGYSSIRAFAEHLQQYPDALTCKITKETTSVLKAELLSSSSQTFHLVFYDEELLAEFVRSDLFGDATFSICPEVHGVKQILVIHGKKYNVVSIFYRK